MVIFEEQDLDLVVTLIVIFEDLFSNDLSLYVNDRYYSVAIGGIWTNA